MKQFWRFVATGGIVLKLSLKVIQRIIHWQYRVLPSMLVYTIVSILYSLTDGMAWFYWTLTLYSVSTSVD